MSGWCTRTIRVVVKWLVLVSTWTGYVACSSTQSPIQNSPSETQDPCHDADIAATRIWNAETRVQVRAQVLQWGGEVGTDVAQKQALTITNSMDRLSDDWARMRKAVCRDHFARHTLSETEYQTRADCMDRALTRQRTFISALSSPRFDVDEQLKTLSRELDECH